MFHGSASGGLAAAFGNSLQREMATHSDRGRLLDAFAYDSALCQILVSMGQNKIWRCKFIFDMDRQVSS